MQVDDASADDVMAQLLVLESQDPDRDIIMYINSPGGSFTAMTAIYDTMQYISPQIQTVVLGQAASAAAVLLAAGAPGKRLALPNARILIHQPAMGEAGHGQASDIEIQAAEILRMRTWLEETLAKHSNKTQAEVNKDIDRDKILSAEEAVVYGLIDQVLTTRKRGAGRADEVARHRRTPRRPVPAMSGRGAVAFAPRAYGAVHTSRRNPARRPRQRLGSEDGGKRQPRGDEEEPDGTHR